jgi:hypothetical protein
LKLFELVKDIHLTVELYLRHIGELETDPDSKQTNTKVMIQKRITTFSSLQRFQSGDAEEPLK